MEILGFIGFILVVAAYIFVGVWLICILVRKVERLNAFVRLVVVSFACAMIFGLGALGGGGEPGFALPATIPVVLLINDTDAIVNSALIPLCFWWLLIFAFMFLKHSSNVWLARRSGGDTRTTIESNK